MSTYGYQAIRPTNTSANGNAPAIAGIVQTDSGTARTLAAADDGTVIVFSSNSAVTVTLPNSLPVDFNVVIVQKGSGTVTCSAASGATLRNRSSYTGTAGQYGAVSLLIISQNTGLTAAEYLLTGDAA